MNQDDLVPMHNGSNLPDHENRMRELLGGIANINNSIEEAGGVASGLPFISINSEGVWYYGQDRTEVEENSHWGIDIRTWKHGYIAWPPGNTKERKPLGERMVPANMPLPQLASLPDVGGPYQLQFSFELTCMTGEDKGTKVLYKNGSYGAKVVNKSLVEEIRLQARRDPSRLCPVVDLLVRDYFHNDWKKTIYNPILKIVKWTTFEDYDGCGQPEQPQPPTQPAVQQPPPPPPQPEPVATGRRRPAVAPEPQAAPQPQPQPQATGRRRPAARVQPSA